MDKEAYKEIVKKNQVRTNWLKEGGLAFLGGGLLGVIAQGLIDFYAQVLHIETELAFSLSSITLVALATLLTMIGVYNNLGQIFGAVFSFRSPDSAIRWSAKAWRDTAKV